MTDLECMRLLNVYLTVTRGWYDLYIVEKNGIIFIKNITMSYIIVKVKNIENIFDNSIYINGGAMLELKGKYNKVKFSRIL